jgi:hypothetical protein
MALRTGTQKSTVPAETIQAYLETDFCAFGNHPVILRVGKRCSKLATLHAAHGTDCSAFITACNPSGALLDDETNANRQAALASALTKLDLTFVEGLGRHPSNQWPPESSFLVFGLTLGAAKRLGKQFAQNAIVWSGSDAVPQLVLLR